MAKKRSDEDEQVVADEAAAQVAYARTAQGQREATMDERVAAAIPPAEPVEVPELTPAAQFLADARAAQAVFQKGEPISPDVLKGLVSRAVGLVAATEEQAAKA
jgi:hypothetical protein